MIYWINLGDNQAGRIGRIKKPNPGIECLEKLPDKTIPDWVFLS